MKKSEICALFGCSLQQLNNQYAANAAILKSMRDKAFSTGKKVNGYTAEQLNTHFLQYNKLSK